MSNNKQAEFKPTAEEEAKIQERMAKLEHMPIRTIKRFVTAAQTRINNDNLRGKRVEAGFLKKQYFHRSGVGDCYTYSTIYPTLKVAVYRKYIKPIEDIEMIDYSNDEAIKNIEAYIELLDYDVERFVEEILRHEPLTIESDWSKIEKQLGGHSMANVLLVTAWKMKHRGDYKTRLTDPLWGAIDGEGLFIRYYSSLCVMFSDLPNILNKYGKRARIKDYVSGLVLDLNSDHAVECNIRGIGGRVGFRRFLGQEQLNDDYYKWLEASNSYAEVIKVMPLNEFVKEVMELSEVPFDDDVPASFDGENVQLRFGFL